MEFIPTKKNKYRNGRFNSVGIHSNEKKINIGTNLTAMEFIPTKKNKYRNGRFNSNGIHSNEKK
ncbi:hypothetical protein DTW91_00195 [Chryseobacterium sp. SC28]|nr:hypothetical protein DTW91_00195 [Chryseobacterium sp. SC28]